MAIPTYLVIFVYSLEDLKICHRRNVMETNIFLVLMWNFFKYTRRRMSSSRELLLLSALIILKLATTDKRTIVVTVIGSVVFFFLTLYDNLWELYDIAIKEGKYFILPLWKGYCQLMRPIRTALKHQIFLPALIVMATLITEGSPPSATCSLTAVSIACLRLSVRVPFL